MSIDTSKARGAARRQGRRHRATTSPTRPSGVRPGRRDADQLPRRRAQRHGAREGALRGPRRRRRRRDQRRRSPSRRSKLIEVDYEVLPHVIDVVEAMQPDAPLLHDDMFTAGVEPKPDEALQRRQARRVRLGDVEAGFKRGRRRRRARVHDQAGAPGLHRAARLRRQRRPRTARPSSGCTTQGHFIVRAHCARLLGIGHRQDPRHRRPRSAAASAARPSSTSSRWRSRCRRRRGRPVKMVMTREEVFRASGPTSGAQRARSRSAPRRTARIVAAEAELKYQAGAFPGSPVQPGAACAPSRPTTSRTSRSSATTWSSTGRRSRPIARPARRSRRSRSRASIDELAEQARHGPDRAAPEERAPRRAPRPPTGRSSARSA